MSKFLVYGSVDKTNVCAPQDLKWYCYRQNNSGGYYVDPAKNIWVQGKDKSDIIARFTNIGIDDSYCECCGDRWYEPWSDSDLSSEPEYYGECLTELKEPPFNFGDKDIPWGLLVFADGSQQFIYTKQG